MPNRIAWIGLVTAALLSAWVVAEWRADPQVVTGAGGETTETLLAEAQIPEPETEFTPVTEFKGTLTRPLFSKGRRPEAAEDETPDDGALSGLPKGPPPNMKLSAIIVTERERSALLMPVGASQSERVKEGETVSGWEVVKIEDDSVVIRSGGQEQTLTLREFGPPGAVPQRAPTPPARTAGTAANRARTAEQVRDLKRRAAERRQAPRPTE